MKDDSRAQLEQSLKLLKTDHVDLYQFHALTKMAELDKVLGPGGAMETMEAAKKEGKIRYIGFSVHSVETALAAMDRYNFDTVLFPLNWVLVSQANFGPQILKKAQEKQMGILCLKSMAKTVWPADEQKNHPEPKCWYQPAAFPDEASLGLRWTLGHPITAAIPPGDEKYFRLAMDVAQNYKPLEPHEEQALLGGGARRGADLPSGQRCLGSLRRSRALSKLQSLTARNCSGGELLHHGQQQLAVALVQIRRVAADLGEEPQFIVGELLGVELAAERVVGEKLGDGQIERQGNLRQRVERGHGVAVFNARKITAQQTGLLFDVALRQALFATGTREWWCRFS